MQAENQTNRVFVDLPDGAKIYPSAGKTKISGWALTDQPISKIEVFCDGVLCGLAEYGTECPEVAEIFPDTPNADRSGFTFTLDLSDISDGQHELEFRFIPNTEEGIFSLSRPFYVRKKHTLPTQASVSDIKGDADKAPETYKAWWTNAPTDLESAKRHVYEAKDEEDFRRRGREGDQQSWGAKQLIQVGNLKEQSIVLEIGCGVARIGRELAPFVAEWHGVDISSTMLEFARQRTEHLSNVFFHELDDINLIAFEDESLDFVYSTVVFMHLDKEDMYEYIKEAFRTLRKGGRAYFDTWNLLNENLFKHFLQTQEYNRGDRKVRNRNQYSTPTEMKKYVTSVGFQVIELIEGELIKVVCEKPSTDNRD